MKKIDDNIIEIPEEIEEEKFEILNHGSLAKDIKKVSIMTKELPEIEMQEYHIKESGNFLGIQGKVINMPIEMIVFPFFTPQKQNRRVNFKYYFDDLGVTMKSTLVVENNKDIVFQPSILEDKIYTFLLSLYERKEEDDDEEYIEFEISDFVVDFLGNKMNRTYYTKIEQALKNLKRTMYEFSINNHKKLGDYKFESELFQLLDYEKRKRGKKVYYKVRLNRNIRKKIQEKRYIIYNSKALIEILNKDHIAARIYKYISQIRYKTGEKNVTNIRTLAAIIPLKVEQETERETKTGVKKYILNRLKPVLTRICKAFDVLVEFGYILQYETEYNKEEDTYYLTYIFNKEKDNTCHISSYLKPKKKKSIEQKTKMRNQNIEEAEVVEKTKKTKGKSYEEEFSETILASLEYLKRNSYIKSLWNQRNDRKISNLLKTEDEAFVVDLLSRFGRSYHENIKASISVYMDGIIKKMRKEEKQMGNNLTLFPVNSFSNSTNVAKTKKQIIQSRPILVKESLTWKEIENKLKKYTEEERKKIEEKALEKYYQETGGNKSFILDAKKNNLARYHKIICSYIEEVLLEQLSDK
ncbi:replication initiator protein A [Fusobacterium gonidiaformans]|uniref:replication initiator protein A n=1 Tax=Fusobacterium gonidiaformans TaxID=849 RepID=UPI0001BC648D|nr:replication initiator protein A [Fusobacterium gonidiaformans]AVQ16285.1 chromosomal replication initiator DnaA [Fusobacterium gonidiaformans ATCC 25563]EFS28494.1 hypothetical protein FGAG_00815 [Fusobacterium gonidiaformans ATCC 25563]